MDNIEVRIHDDFNDYKEKFYGFTLRQWLAIIAVLIINIPVYFYGRNILGEEAISWIVIIIAMPIVSVGFISVQGLPMEKMFLFILRSETTFYNSLKYKTSDEIEKEKQFEKQLSVFRKIKLQFSKKERVKLEQEKRIFIEEIDGPKETKEKEVKVSKKQKRLDKRLKKFEKKMIKKNKIKKQNIDFDSLDDEQFRKIITAYLDKKESD